MGRIEIIHGEFIQARIKLHPQRCVQLGDEYAGLIWDERSAKREERFDWPLLTHPLEQPSGCPLPS